jgi:ketosteroid isomerase-like protein
MTLMTDIATHDVAHRFAAAFGTRLVDRVLECFTPDAEYHDLFYGRFRGQAELRRLFGRMYAEGDRHEWTMTRVVSTPACTIGEWHFAFTVSARVPRSSARRLTFDGVSVFETRAGRCHAYREYFDRTAALRALGISPAAIDRITAGRPTVQVTGNGPGPLRA